MEGVWSKNEVEIKIFMSRWGLALRTQGFHGSLCESKEKHYELTESMKKEEHTLHNEPKKSEKENKSNKNEKRPDVYETN